MSKLEYPKCPYCSKKVSYMKSGFITSKPEHKCEACDKISTVTVKHSVFTLIRVVSVFTIALLLFASFFRSFSPLEVDIIIIIDVVCMALLPCYTELVKKNDKLENDIINTEKKAEN